MPSVETRPYLTAAETTVAADPWVHERNGLPEALPPSLADWDPMQDVMIKRTLTIDPAKLRKDCGFGSDVQVALAVSWRSPGSGQRGIAVRRIIDCTGNNLVINVEARLRGSELAGSVRIITRLLLHHGGTTDTPLAARRAGAILWEESFQLQLEGIGSRFPMEVVDFSMIGLPPKAAWRLQWNRGNIHAQAMGCFCLLLNKSHRRVLAAASRTSPDAEARVIWSAINSGVAREIITGVLADDSFMAEEGPFEEGSVGEIARALIDRAFPGNGPRGALEMLENSPDRFECALQAAFNLFDPVS